MHPFDALAPLNQVLNRFVFTPERVTKAARECPRRKP
jgi:hypothetical protein